MNEAVLEILGRKTKKRKNSLKIGRYNQNRMGTFSESDY